MSRSKTRTVNSPEPTFSRDDLLSALSLTRPIEQPTGYMTTAEMCQATGMHAAVLRERLRTLSARKRLEATPVSRIGIDGRCRQVNAYRILPEPCA